MNVALREALAASRLTETDVAANLGVDPKTVRRWLSGQRPYPRHRWALADLLQTEEGTLWPDEATSAEKLAPVSAHAHAVHAHRWEVPRERWRELFEDAEQEIGILVYSGLFLADDAGILRLIEARAGEGVSVRILLGDPDSEPVKQRGRDEQIGEVLSARASNALLLFRALMNVEGVEIRTHATTLYNSIYLTEKKLLVNQHIYGISAAQSPVVEISRDPSTNMADTYARSFELVWQKAAST